MKNGLIDSEKGHGGLEAQGKLNIQVVPNRPSFLHNVNLLL